MAGKNIPADSALNGKAIYLADIERLIRQPGQVLAQAQTDAQPYSAPTATAAAPVAAGNGPKRVLAVTACPTGVAHTFMAAEAIDTEAKSVAGGSRLKRGVRSVQAMSSPQKKWRRPTW